MWLGLDKPILYENRANANDVYATYEIRKMFSRIVRSKLFSFDENKIE